MPRYTFFICLEIQWIEKAFGASTNYGGALHATDVKRVVGLIAVSGTPGPVRSSKILNCVFLVVAENNAA